MSRSEILTFEIPKDGNQLEIHLDEIGLTRLIEILERLQKVKSPLPRHDHLMTPAWAGTELTEERQGDQNTLLNKVTITLWP